MPNTYTTRQGQCWDEIAKELWGSETLTHKLLEANPEHRGLVFLPADLEIKVPDVTIEPVEVPPPWKQL